ncbi:MAG: PEP-CTERM sorting domain-containing protein [Acetobacteraceae bacterium]
MKRVLLGTTAAAAVAVAGLLPAMAVPTAFGSLYEVSSAVAMNAVPGNVPAGPATVTFTAPSDPLSFNPADTNPPYTIGAWLATGGATILSGSSHLGDSMDNTLINFTGTVTVTTGQTFIAGHDDGVTLTIGGLTVISAPGPTALTPTTATYTGPSGNQPFQLVYGECCGPPAALVVDLPLVSPVPEPAALAVFGAGLLGLGFIRRRKPG